MHDGFMSEKGKIDAAFILKSCKKSITPKEKRYMCFAELEKAIDRVAREVLDLATRKKGIPEVFVRSEMSLCDEVKTRVIVNSELLEEFEVKVRTHNRFYKTKLYAWLHH